MILVTGGAGYVGSALVPALLNAGESVRVVDLLWFERSLPAHPRLHVVQQDVLDVEPAWLRDVSAVIHLAGFSNDASANLAPAECLRSNVTATARLADVMAQVAAHEQREIRCLFASSCSLYAAGPPASPGSLLAQEEVGVIPLGLYAQTKYEAEASLLAAAQACPEFCPVLLRKGTIMGAAPRMRFDLVANSITCDAWRSGVISIYGSANHCRPMLHLSDAVEAYLTLLAQPSARVRNQIVNVAGENRTIPALAHLVASTLREERGAKIEVVRALNQNDGGRSYRASSEKLYRMTGYRARRTVRDAALSLWDALVAGDFGSAPETDLRFYNEPWLKRLMAAPEANALAV